MQKTAINLIDKIISTENKQEIILNVMELILVLKSLTIDEFEEFKNYAEAKI